MRYIKRFLLLLIILLIVLALTIFLCDKKISDAADGKLYSETTEIPYNKVGLVLGTGKYLPGRIINPYYEYRIDATVALYRSKKIKFIIVSGDNSHMNYNEPAQIKSDLMKKAIDSSLIYLDYAGFRTFDSMVRLNKIFGQDSVTVISQQFHNERAIYIASREGIHAIGYNAKDVNKEAGVHVKMREKLARVKVFLDYLYGTDPKFLGPRVIIPD